MLFWKTKSQVMAEEINFLRQQVAQLQSYVLATTPINTPQSPIILPMEGARADLPIEVPNSEKEAERWLQLAMSEAEEDIEWARQAGDITDSRAAQLMAELRAGGPDET